MTTLYVRLDKTREIRLDITARFHNRISSDPKIIERQPSISEIFEAAKKIVPGAPSEFYLRSQIED